MYFTKLRGLFRARQDIKKYIEHMKALEEFYNEIKDCSNLVMIVHNALGCPRTREDIPRCHGNFSKFFGPSPRKHWLTVYGGLQVRVCVFGNASKQIRKRF